MIKKEYDDGKKHIHVISFGGGVQSIALTIKALRGEVNGVIPDYIIFSDPGNEEPYVYEQIQKVNDYIKQHFDSEIIFTTGGNIYDDVMNATVTGKRVASLPYHTQDGTGKEYLDGIGKRQCTNDYKIEPVKKKIRDLLGYKPKQRVKEKVHIWKGISTDEIERVKPIQCTWRIAEHPLVDVLNIDRSACNAYVERTLGFTPHASSCEICPFHDNTTWLKIKKEDPAGFERACQLDEQIRHGLKYKNKLYLHKSRKPLREVDLQEDQTTIDDFINECEGFCGI